MRSSLPRRLLLRSREPSKNQSQRLKLRLQSQRKKVNWRLLIMKLRKLERSKPRMLWVRLLLRLDNYRKKLKRLLSQRRPQPILVMRFGLLTFPTISDKLKLINKLKNKLKRKKRRMKKRSPMRKKIRRMPNPTMKLLMKKMTMMMMSKLRPRTLRRRLARRLARNEIINCYPWAAADHQKLLKYSN